MRLSDMKERYDKPGYYCPLRLLGEQTDMLINKMSLAMYLQALRQMAHYTQEEVAAISGLSVGTISRIECGKDSTLSSVMKFAKVCGCQLLLEKDNSNATS